MSELLFANTSHLGNLRLQEMMGIMAEQRGGKVCAMDERYVTML